VGQKFFILAILAIVGAMQATGGILGDFFAQLSHLCCFSSSFQLNRRENV
jgi:hypothetical protein